MGMLSDRDIEKMGNDIRDAITDWDTAIILKVPKPVGQQPNYNKLMKEFTGAISYDEYPIDGEWRSKAESKQLNTSVSGNQMINKSILVLPNIIYVDSFKSINTIDICDKDTIVFEGSDKYRITSIRTNIGQVSLELLQLEGSEI